MYVKTKYALLLSVCGIGISQTMYSPPIHEAIKAGDINTVGQFICTPYNSYIIHEWNEEGFTPLQIAAENEYRDIAYLLISNYADINQPCADGWTPIHGAASSNYEDCARLLLECNANPNTIQADG